MIEKYLKESRLDSIFDLDLTRFFSFIHYIPVCQFPKNY